MKKLSVLNVILLTAVASIVVFTSNVIAADDSLNYITPEETKSKIESGEALTLLDIQIEDEYTRHHIRGSLATYAYPVKSDAEKAKLDNFIPYLSSRTDTIVIICPRGGGGAKRTFEYLASRGIESKRMYILEKGQGGWPYPRLIEAN
jgi:thiosulfate/3-mercaptopyruvate sulfurtransferase